MRRDVDRACIRALEAFTGLVYCDEDCFCGQNDRTLKVISGHDMPAWVPAWMNDIEPAAVERWLLSDESYATDEAHHLSMMPDVLLVRDYGSTPERNVIGPAWDFYDTLGHALYTALHLSGGLRFATHLEAVAYREGVAAQSYRGV